MRFPSLQSLAGGAWRTFLRFPIAILLAIKATILGICWTHLNTSYAHRYIDVSTAKPAPSQWYWNAIVSCYLGMLLSVALTKWVEKRQFSRNVAIGLQAAVIALAAAYYWSLPSHFSSQMILRTVVLALALHWLIAVIGFGRGEVNAFWIFNKRLFMRVLTTYLYSMVLYIGVALALLAIDQLFNANVRSEVYEYCWWVLGGMFSIWFFLAGFPSSYENPEAISDYPRGLKIFTQYVLLSLVMIYMLILYAYMFKIVFTAHWPVGWVAWLVMAFAVAGILSLLLIYPLRDEEGNTWIRGYSKFYYVALLPLIMLLFCAIYKRVMPYGITEQRYFLVSLAFWLLFVTLYFLLSRKKDIRLVPLSLCLLAFLSVWGPWGAFSISMHSQRHRLTGLLEKYGLMANGKVVTGRTDVKVALKDRQTISSIMDYLVSEHGTKSLQPIFTRNLDSVLGHDDAGQRYFGYQQSAPIMQLINVPYANRWDTDTNGVVYMTTLPRTFEYHPGPGSEIIPTAGASNAAPFSFDIMESDSCHTLAFGADRLVICPDTGVRRLTFTLGASGAPSVVDLTAIIRNVIANNAMDYSQAADQVSLPLTGGALGGSVILTDVRGVKRDQNVTFQHIEGVVLFSRK